MREEDGLDCLDLLEETPSILRGLRRELNHEDAEWKPAPDRFSVAEALAHLSHSEGHCYRTRLDRFMREEMPEFEPDDAQMYLDLYRGADPEISFDHFEEQREINVEYLRTLPRSAGDRRAHHKAAGEITLQQMLHEWAMHDLGHIRQIAELVRARKHWRQAGPLGEDYELKPWPGPTGAPLRAPPRKEDQRRGSSLSSGENRRISPARSSTRSRLRLARAER